MLKCVYLVKKTEFKKLHLAHVTKDNTKLLDIVKIVTINVLAVPEPLLTVAVVLQEEKPNQFVTVLSVTMKKKETQNVQFVDIDVIPVLQKTSVPNVQKTLSEPISQIVDVLMDIMMMVLPLYVYLVDGNV